MNRLKKYPSKVLLFGEYTVLSGGNALAVPVKNLTASWIKVDTPDDSLSEMFYQWCNYLGENISYIHVGKLRKDWKTGYRFVTNILTGYGVGSSGVLTAIVFDQYRMIEKPADLVVFKKKLGGMESFFHGQSSGLDPLVSYLNKPVMVLAGKVEEYHSRLDFQGWKVYLLDSGQKRSTSDLVPVFKQKISEKSIFNLKIENELKRDVNEILNIVTKHSGEDFAAVVKRISEFQWEYMSWLVHENVKQLWQESLNNPYRAIKICGAGGGGYYLMFSREEIKDISVPFIGPLDFG